MTVVITSSGAVVVPCAEVRGVVSAVVVPCAEVGGVVATDVVFPIG
jgi:hypothetical protein